MHNWSGHVEFRSTEVQEPASLDELRMIVARSRRVRALGTGHSFNDIADTTGVHITLSGLPQAIEIDSDRGIAWLPGGMRYGTAARALDAQGWAIPNMASLGHISIAGTVATGTHGSGDRIPTLAASVVALERVRADGEVEVVDQATTPESLAGSVVALGCLGVVSRVALRIEPRFDIRQYVIDGISHDTIEGHFDEVFSSSYSVSFFTTWSPDRVGQVWLKRRVGVDADWIDDGWMGGHVAGEKRHPLPGHDPVHCTEQLGTVGPWHERLPHFKLDFTPSSGEELQTEYLVPRDAAVAALKDVAAIAPQIHALLQVSEVRTMCADDLWLSGAYGRPTVGIHFTWRKTPAVLNLLPQLDAVLGEHGGRPHWGKLFAPVSPVAWRYPRFPDFATAVSTADPHGKFRNGFVETLLDTV